MLPEPLASLVSTKGQLFHVSFGLFSQLAVERLVVVFRRSGVHQAPWTTSERGREALLRANRGVEEGISPKKAAAVRSMS